MRTVGISGISGHQLLRKLYPLGHTMPQLAQQFKQCIRICRRGTVTSVRALPSVCSLTGRATSSTILGNRQGFRWVLHLRPSLVRNRMESVFDVSLLPFPSRF
jgi:hypothetical protein